MYVKYVRDVKVPKPQERKTIIVMERQQQQQQQEYRNRTGVVTLQSSGQSAPRGMATVVLSDECDLTTERVKHLLYRS